MIKVFLYQYSQKDSGAFVHNPKYVIQFLIDSIADLGGDVSKYTRPEVPALPNKFRSSHYGNVYGDGRTTPVISFLPSTVRCDCYMEIQWGRGDGWVKNAFA